MVKVVCTLWTMRQDPSLRTSFLMLVAATSILVMIIGWYFFREYGDSSRLRQNMRKEARFYAPPSLWHKLVSWY